MSSGRAKGPRGPGHLLMAFFSPQVIQEVSGLPLEGASEGNQYGPDAQRLNYQKVSLYSALGGQFEAIFSP